MQTQHPGESGAEQIRLQVEQIVMEKIAEAVQSKAEEVGQGEAGAEERRRCFDRTHF